MGQAPPTLVGQATIPHRAKGLHLPFDNQAHVNRICIGRVDSSLQFLVDKIHNKE